MGSDAKQPLAAAEQLLAQGKLQEALGVFSRLTEGGLTDPLTINRIGDTLARAGHAEPAVGYYARIADLFSRQGFLSKAIAMRKKILRLAPANPAALAALADLYVRQEHPAEARGYYLRAAEQHLRSRDFEGAQGVYTRLVAAEPDDPRHRVRLAETRAAAGDTAGGARELADLGRRLLRSGKPDDGEKALRRAAELAPDSPQVALGLAECLSEMGREDEAVLLLERACARSDADPEILAELLVLYEVHARPGDADRLLAREGAECLPDRSFEEVFRFHERRATLDVFWVRLAVPVRRWSADSRRRTRARALLEASVSWSDLPFLQALEWLERLAIEDGDRAGQGGLLERLVAAYQAHGQEEQALEALVRLEEVHPRSVLLASADGPSEPEVRPDTGTRAAPAPPRVVLGGGLDFEIPVEYEAPAVPLSRADEEFVSGRLTQAEILEKYGLVSQAIEQFHEILERFPGHLETAQRLVALIRGTANKTGLGQALIGLALARRAAGRVDVARQAIAEAVKLTPIDARMQAILIALGLLAEETAAPAAAAPRAQERAPRPARPAAAAARRPAKPVAEVAAVGRDAVIDFDDGEDEANAEGQGLVPVVPADPDSLRFEPLPSLADGQEDDDLAAIAASLDDALFLGAESDESPVAEGEETLAEVFAAFRERVEAEVDADDYQTHYDLGIGYKEMGLVDAAISEFRISAQCADLFRHSCVMLALCCRVQDRLQDAADWYRQALGAPGSTDGTASDLRYELAEVLLAAGDRASALGLFQDLMDVDPSFRDVSRKVEQLAGSSE